MRKLDSETGNKERTIDMKVVRSISLAQIPSFNKMEGVDFIGRLEPFLSRH